MSNPSFAEFKRHPKVRGVSVGSCVEGTGKHAARVALERDEQAHAHYDPSDKFFGWICVQSPEDLGSKHHVSRTLMHELAHLLSPMRNHDDRWRNKMRTLGQPITKRYQKRVRNVAAH